MEPLGEVQFPEERSEVVGEKRLPVEDGDVLSEDGSPPKRVKEGSVVAVGDVKKVAEMVLVLAAMGKMRGGKGPTEAEKELMTEARDTLVKICQGFSPKDVFPRDSFGGLIDDLGLNKSKEQRLGFRPPKISIADKLLISKRKMEKAEDFSLPSTPHSLQNLQGNSSQSVESRSALHPARTSQLDKSSHVTMLSGIQSTTPLTYVTSTTSASLPYQLPTSEVRPMSSSTLSSSHLASTALPRVDRPHLRSNGSSHASQVPANLSSNATVRTPAWSMQPQSVSSAKIGDTRGPVNMSLKVEGAAEIKSAVPQARAMTVSQTTAVPPSRGTNNVQTPHMGNTHAEISKIVQKLLQVRGSARLTWIPPSRDYMNKSLTCQVCMSTITEIDSVLICDGCEKGYHLKCLQTTNQKGVPRGEWHCGKCLSLSNGKPLPPKYGRVMRNATPPKVTSNSTAGPSSSQSVGASGAVKAGPLNVTVNGGISTPNVSTEVEVDSYDRQISGTKREHSRGMQNNDVNSAVGRTENKISYVNDPINVMKTSAGSVLSVNSLVETCGEKVVEINSNPPECVMAPRSSDNFQVIKNAQDGNKDQPNVEAKPLKKSLQNNLMVSDSNQLNEQEVLANNSVNISGDTCVINKDRPHLRAVSWVGDPLQILDEKIYYSSCCINGHVYKAMDHVLIQIDNEKLLPSRLQSMWEDNNTTTKWVTVKRCYFPGDLPATVGRPCGLENCEVYESSCGRALMAGLIESPCQVLPPRKFAEESERRTISGTQHNLPPLYLCKWIYDEAKGLFRDISC